MPGVLLDTSVLCAGRPVRPGLSAAISAVSIAELQFGVLRSRDEGQRAQRLTRLGLVTSRFPSPLPVDDLVAREWGNLMAAVVARGGQPRRRAADLAIAATARVHGVPLVTGNGRELAIIDDLVDVRAP